MAVNVVASDLSDARIQQLLADNEVTLLRGIISGGYNLGLNCSLAGKFQKLPPVQNLTSLAKKLIKRINKWLDDPNLEGCFKSSSLSVCLTLCLKYLCFRTR